ncbi:MAG: glycosyltransferase [Patescibacteria group bacterium]|nr:glycosyltransferase [Patescibacteria group bacterium]
MPKKIILASVGSRGDMEPFLTIGEMLKKKGHHVICAFPEQFRSLAEDAGLEFASLGSKFIEMLFSDLGKTVMGGGGSKIKKFIATFKLAKSSLEVNKELANKQREVIDRENPDLVLHHIKALYPVVWSTKHPGKAIQINPVPYLNYVKDHAHLGLGDNYGTLLNKLTYIVADFGLIETIKASAKWINIKDITRKQIKKARSANGAIYTISPSLFQRPSYWPSNIQVLGYHERNKAINWQPSEELNQFLKRHNKIILVTFGSMTNPKPAEKTKIILDILQKHNIPAIINTACGGLEEPKEYNKDLLHFVNLIPYDYILPKMYAVIHHGGTGTTHAALKNGCASLIIPHIIDQYIWNKTINKLGAGPKGIEVGKITATNLEPKILDLVNNASYKEQAETIAKQMEQENFTEELYQTIISPST